MNKRVSPAKLKVFTIITAKDNIIEIMAESKKEVKELLTKEYPHIKIKDIELSK